MLTRKSAEWYLNNVLLSYKSLIIINTSRVPVEGNHHCV